MDKIEGLDIGFHSVGDLVKYGWKETERLLDPEEIILDHIAIIDDQTSPDFHIPYQIVSLDPKGFKRYELADTIAQFYKEKIEKDNSSYSDIFSVYNGMLQVYVNRSTNPVTVYFSLDY